MCYLFYDKKLVKTKHLNDLGNKETIDVSVWFKLPTAEVSNLHDKESVCDKRIFIIQSKSHCSTVMGVKMLKPKLK